jgi:hypothetical protein
MKRPKFTGSICQIGERWYAYGPEQRIAGKRVKALLGSFESSYRARRFLDAWVADQAKQAEVTP